MNFNKSFDVSPEMRSALPGKSARKPHKNFLIENVRNLRQMQQQMIEARNSLEQKVKKLQRPKKSPFTVVSNVNKNPWVQLPVSDESLSGRCVSAKSAKHVTSMSNASSTPPRSDLVDTGCQTSPLLEDTYSDKISSTNLTESIILTKSETNTSEVQGDDSAKSIRELAINRILKENGVNYVELNRQMQYKRKPIKPKQNTTGIPPNYQLGVVPKYLKDKKTENNTKIKESNELSEDINKLSIDNSKSLAEDRPGHVLLSEEERLDHLKMMKKCYEDLLVQFNQLPIRSDSLKAKQKRADLEKQLDNLEKSMKIFSRERLYIKL